MPLPFTHWHALGKCQFVDDMALLWLYIRSCFGGHFMNILSHVAGKAPSQFWRRLCWQVIQCAITGLGLHSQRYLQTCLLFMVQESIPSCCIFPYLSSIQSLSRVQLCNPMDCRTLGLPVHPQLPELIQTHVYHVGDAIQPSHPLSSPSPAFILSQHQGLFQWVSSSHQVAKVLKFQLHHQSFQ